MKQDLINDGLHIAWGAWIVVVASLLPLWVLAPLAVLPREAAQTWHKLEEKTWAAFRLHADRRYWLRKGRDLLGFVIGGALIALVV